jgi:hypothetical protein
LLRTGESRSIFKCLPLLGRREGGRMAKEEE